MSDSRRQKTVLVLLEPDGAARTYQLRVSYRMLGWLVALLILGLSCFVGAIIVASRTAADARRTQQTQALNDSLRVEFGRFSHIESELEQLRTTNHQLLRLVGVEPTDADSTAKYNLDPDKWLGKWQLTQPTLAPRIGIVSRGFTEGGGRRDHLGVDVAGPEGSLVVASGGGIVVSADYTEVYGNELLLDHGNGVRSFYGHNKEVLVAAGDSVHAGEAIARLGNTGQSSAPHLHFEVRVDGTPVDPGEFVREYQATNP